MSTQWAMVFALLVAALLILLAIFWVLLRDRNLAGKAGVGPDGRAITLPEAYLIDLLDKTKAEHRITQAITNIGRAPGNHISISEERDPTRWVSAFHAALEFRENGFYIVDKDSKNGTYLNDSTDRLPIHQKVPVKGGDIIKIASKNFCFKLCVPSQGDAHHTQYHEPTAIMIEENGKEAKG